MARKFSKCESQEDKDKVSRYLSFSEEFRFSNSEKKYVSVEINDNKIIISLSDKKTEHSISRSDFKKILDDKFGWLDREKQNLQQAIHKSGQLLKEKILRDNYIIPPPEKERII